MTDKLIYTKGYNSSGCPTCDCPSQSDEVIFDTRELIEILREAWQERNEYRFSNIYSQEGELLCEFYYDYSRHCTIGMRCKTPNGWWKVEDDGRGNKDFVFYGEPNE